MQQNELNKILFLKFKVMLQKSISAANRFTTKITYNFYKKHKQLQQKPHIYRNKKLLSDIFLLQIHCQLKSPTIST
jgi:hypothetical protein